jgi:peptide-methionine (S)-S-oxide reductase
MRSIVWLLAVGGFANAILAPAGGKEPMKSQTEFAVLGGGCFWCMEAVFDHVPGVKAVVCGYAGGHTKNPTYEEVCTDTTGHAEVVRIEFGPAVITYQKLLGIFWDSHDPTTRDRQGADEGTQYRSIILYANQAQQAEAEQSKTAAQAGSSQPIVTEIVPLQKFYPAEEHHQHYFAKNPSVGYCRLVIRPKIAKLQQAGVISK